MMTKSPFFFFGMLFLLMVNTPFAQAQSKATAKKMHTIEGITEYQLPNGMKVLLFPDPSKPTITVNVTYLVGSRHEGYGETGMAHLLEHLVFKGTPNHPDIPSELTSHGAKPNGTTWYDRTNYFETFSATDENLEWALDMEADRMVNSHIAKEDLVTEMTVVRNEFEMGENDPTGILYERVISTAYLWHNYGKSTIGARSDIEDVPIERLKAFYHKYYQPDNAVLLVAGKIDKAKTLTLIEKYFGAIPKPNRTTPLYPTYTREPVQDGERFVELKRVGDAQAVSCVYHTPPGPHPEFAAIQVLNEVLTSQPSGRLYTALVDAKKASWVWGHAPGLREPSYLYFNAEVRLENDINAAKDALLKTLDEMADNPPTTEEVERAKARILKYWDLNFNDANKIGVYMSSYIAAGDWRLLFLFRDRIEAITAEEVAAAANKYLKPTNRTVGVFIPTKNPERVEVPEVKDVLAYVKDYKGREQVAMGEAFDPSPGNIDDRTEEFTIASGAKVAFLQKENRGDAVHAKMTFRYGNLPALMGKATVADLTANLLKTGTKTYTRQQIEDKLDDLKASVNFYGGYSSVTANIETEHGHLTEVLELVMDILQNATFPKEEFDKTVVEYLTFYESQKSEPRSIASNEINKLTTKPYPKDDPRYASSFDEDIASLKALKWEEVKGFHQQFYGASDATISIVGDFDKMATKKVLEAGIGTWKSPQRYERIPSEYYAAPSANKSLNTPDKANAMFLVNQPLNIKKDHPDYPALVLGNFILGGGFLNSRLATRIRQNEGLSYGVGSWLWCADLDKNGSFGSYAIYAPENVEKLEKAYMEEIARMLTDGFTEEEVKNAKSGFLQKQQVNRSEDKSLSGSLEKNLFLGKKMAWTAELESKIEGLTAKEIHAAMQRHIDPKKFVMVKAGDFEKLDKDSRP